MESKSRFASSPDQACDRLESLLDDCAQLVAVVPAAGRGQRAGLPLPKQYHRLGGKTVLARTIKALAHFSPIAAVIVVLDPEDGLWHERGLDAELAGLDHVVAVAIGGATRRESVIAGCALARRATGGRDDLWVMVHDAARPGVSQASLERLWASMQPQRGTNEVSAHGAILALPVADTVKRIAPVSGQNTEAPVIVEQTLDRSRLWSAQTPQLFQIGPLLSAYSTCPMATDEASAIEEAGGQVSLVQGEPFNMKITTADDVVLMEALMNATQPEGQPIRQAQPAGMNFAIGQGFDVHALVAGRPLIIGGVEIPFEKGLEGHSDADVLLHAITDAILGAAAMGDIGRHFPDTDPEFKGADSKKLLQEAVARVHAKGWQVAQIDATVIAQQPKISPYAEEMVRIIALCVAAPRSCINIKGKTTEHLGFTGRGEGIAAQAVAMLVRTPT